MLRICCLLSLAVVSPMTYAHVPGGHTGVAAQLAHQSLGLHHLPFTVLLVVVGAIAIRSWCNARKRTR